MLKKLILAFCFFFSAFCAFAQKQVPDVQVFNEKGESVSILSLIPSGKPVVLTFWDTSCKPCIQELSAYADSYDDWKDEFDFEIVAVSTDDSRGSSKVVPFVKGRGWPFVIALDRNGDLKRALNVQSNPTLFILDGKGKVLDFHVGYNPGNEDLVYKILKEISTR